jgi:hypothetical protein
MAPPVTLVTGSVRQLLRKEVNHVKVNEKFWKALDEQR